MAATKGGADWGGARPGAGRKKKEPQPPVQTAEDDPLQLLLRIMRGEVDATPIQLRAAIAAAQYVHTKRHDGGKKDEAAEKAKRAASGRFAPKAPPKLVVNNG